MGKTLAFPPLTTSLVAGSAMIGWPFEKRSSLESVAGWKTARVQRPVQILGSLDGIETGIRRRIRDQPLETIPVDFNQLAKPQPYDLKAMDLSTYKGLDSRWHDWTAVKAVALQVSSLIFDRVLGTVEYVG